jgi:hypothetical protein
VSDDEIRTVSGEILDDGGGVPARAPDPDAGAGGRSPYGAPGTGVGWSPDAGRIEVRTFDLRGPALPGGGWTTLAIGRALLGLGAWRRGRGAGGRTLAVVGGVLAAVGGIQAAGSVIPGFPSLGQLVIPVVIVGIGALVLTRALRGR